MCTLFFAGVTLGSSLKPIVMKLTRKNLKITKKTLFYFTNKSKSNSDNPTIDPISTMVTTVIFTTH